MKLNILFEDEEMIVVDKPAGLLSIPDRFDKNSPNLGTILRNNYPSIHVVHRLDRDTSGVIIFAKNAEAHAFLSQEFEGREVTKKYLALVNGIPPEAGEINVPLIESQSKPGVMVASKKGKESLTHYKLISAHGVFSLVEVQIFTGRMHQIRVHMAYEGHPLFIDPVYGSRSEFLLSELKGRKYKISKNEEAELPLATRQTLHSFQLSIKHPVTKEYVTFEAPIPKDFKALINQADKHFKSKAL